MRKAQVSIEFLSMVGVVLVMFMGFYAIIAAQNKSTSDVNLQFNLQRVCNDFATAINLAAAGGSGFTAHMSLPQKVNNFDYNLSITTRTLYANTSRKSVSCRLITNKFSYSQIEKGRVDLKNINGTIFIEKG